MKLVCISDTHNTLKYIVDRIPDGDVLIHAGDFTSMGTKAEIEEFNEAMGMLPHKHKIVIAGNHDIGFEANPEEAQALLSSVTYLEDSGVEIDGVKFWGSPWQPQFFDWAFNLHRGPQLAEKWALIPDDTNVLITHGPPLGIRDLTHRQGRLAMANTGCKDLQREVLNRIKPKVHVFGHIHESYGVSTIQGIHFINASILNEKYQIQNKPVIYNIESA